jgi:hypothetical protein
LAAGSRGRREEAQLQKIESRMCLFRGIGTKLLVIDLPNLFEVYAIKGINVGLIPNVTRQCGITTHHIHTHIRRVKPTEINFLFLKT